MAFAGIVCAVCRDRSDILIRWYLRQQFGEHRGISNARTCDLDRLNLQRFRVDGAVQRAR